MTTTTELEIMYFYIALGAFLVCGIFAIRCMREATFTFVSNNFFFMLLAGNVGLSAMINSCIFSQIDGETTRAALKLQLGIWPLISGVGLFVAMFFWLREKDAMKRNYYHLVLTAVQPTFFLNVFSLVWIGRSPILTTLGG